MNASQPCFGVLNGPGLDRLGRREPAIYGASTLADLEGLLQREAEGLGVTLECFQSAVEGLLVEKLGAWADQGLAGVVFNPAAYTHTSVALRDAIAGSGLACVEVHLTNIWAREEFRHRSLTAGVCVATIAGMGFEGYCAGLRFLVERHRKVLQDRA